MASGQWPVASRAKALTERSEAGARNPFNIRARFRHRFEVDPAYVETLEHHGLIFSGKHPEQPIMQVLELPRSVHPYFIGAQFHPELTSRPLRPQPMFLGLVAAAIAHAHPELDPASISSRWLLPADARTREPSETAGTV